MSLYYYTDENGEVQGPHEWENITLWVQDGSIPQGTYIQDEHQQMEWTLYSDMTDGGEEEEQQQQAGGGQWQDSVWHYLDDNAVVQGPYTTQTIGEWYYMGALGVERYCSIDGGEWIQLHLTEPFLALWGIDNEGTPGPAAGPPVAAAAARLASAEAEEEALLIDRQPAQRRQSVTMMAAQRSHARRASVAKNVVASLPVRTSKRPTNLATKLNSQRSLLRKTDRAPNKKRKDSLPKKQDNTMNALVQGLELRRTIITRGKKRRSSINTMNRPVFKMADGTVPPESVVRGTRTHRRRASDFSEDEDDSDGWLSD